MLFENVAIAGLAHVDAPHAVTSAEIEERLAPVYAGLGMQHGLLYGLTGIAERRVFDEGVMPSEVAAKAAARALEDAGLPRERVGVLISTSVCKDYVEPSVAAIVHGLLELPSTCLNFDVGNACLGFLNGMHLVGTMIERGQIEYGLVVDGENSRFVLEQTLGRLLAQARAGALAPSDLTILRNQLATLTLGSGAAAMVLARRDRVPHAPRLVGGVALAATEHRNLCRGQADYMETDAAALLTHGLELAVRTFGAAQQVLGWMPRGFGQVLLHQVSAVHTARYVERLGLDNEVVYKLYPKYGNVGPASIPIALSKARDEGRLAPGARVGLMGIGSGLNCSMMEIQW